MEELLGGELSREDRIFCLGGLIAPLAWTGKPFEPYVRELDESLEEERDGNVLNVGVGTRAAVSLAEGRYADAREAAVEAARLSPFNGPSALSIAAHAATWGRDHDGVADVLAAHIGTAAHGGVIDLRRLGMRAAIAGLEGRREESLLGFRTSIEGLSGLGAQLEETLTAVDMVASVGSEHADAAIAQSARRWFEERGALPFLARLDELSGVTTDRSPRDAPSRVARQPA
jgi:hypothetical protein